MKEMYCPNHLSWHNIFSGLSAEDGALLGKIEKVRVLRNDRREGEWFITL